MADQISIEPFTLKLPSGSTEIRDVQTALDILTEKWPDERGPRHRDAEELCLKIIDGHRSARELPEALRAAAKEAGLSAT